MTPTVTRLIPAAVAWSLLAASPFAVAATVPHNWEESGQASWYGPGLHGARTSSGTFFDRTALTAAHDQLPLGTRVRVTMQDTGQSVVVTITDRMPPKRLRVIDLSQRAAREIGLLGRGVGMVTLSEAPPPETIEVAEAPDDDEPDLSPRPRGLRHMRPAARTASAHRPCCHALSASLARR